MNPNKIYYEPNIIHYELGRTLLEKYKNIPQVTIDNHNNIEELRTNPNSEFGRMKQYIIIGTRKTHKYVPNHKSSDFLVPYTSSGCSAMCLYCYLVCNYNKCSYLRLFVNREQMMDKLVKTSNKSETELTFEIGSNSDLVLENTFTNNLPWTIENFAERGKGFITFPTKFDMVDPLLNLKHKGKTLIRMSVNPQEIISKIEIGTSNLLKRIEAINKVCDDGYKVGLLIAPIIMVENWRELYSELIETLAKNLSEKVKREINIEIIFMTYSYVHRMINNEAFPGAPELYSKESMTGRGMGKYCYNKSVREQGELFFKTEIAKKLGPNKIMYIV